MKLLTSGLRDSVHRWHRWRTLSWRYDRMLLRRATDHWRDKSFVMYLAIVLGGAWDRISYSVLCGPRALAPLPSQALRVRAVAMRARQIELCILGMVVVEVVLLLCVTPDRPVGVARALAYAVPVYHIMGILFSAINITIVHPEARRGRSNIVASPSRTVLLSAFNYVELALAFAVIYGLNSDLVVTDPPRQEVGNFDCLLFSAMTQMTLVYGNWKPSGGLLPVTTIQAAMGLMVIVLIVGKMVAALREPEGVLDQ